MVGALLLFVQFLMGREVKRYDATAKDHTERLRTLETDRVTKGDITAVYDRLNKLSDRAEERHSELLRRIR